MGHGTSRQSQVKVNDMNYQAPPSRNPAPNVKPFNRRFSDDRGRSLEHAARTVAHNEGALSEAWLALQRIDKYRRMGRVIEITMLYKLHDESFHRIKWEERESEFAKIHGYINPRDDVNKERRKGVKLLYLASAFIVGFYFGSAFIFGLR